MTLDATALLLFLCIQNANDALHVCLTRGPASWSEIPEDLAAKERDACRTRFKIATTACIDAASTANP